MAFLELTNLNREQTTHLLTLQKILQKQFQSSPVLYWHILKKIRPSPCNILAYAGSELIGFCSRYLFHSGECEISILVHPKFQTDFFIKQLIFSVIKYIPPEHKKDIVISTPHSFKPPIKPEADWVYLHSSIRLQWQGPVKKPDALPEFYLGKAIYGDFTGFKHLSEKGFPNGTDMSPEIFAHIVDDHTTQLWLLKKDSQVIGSIQINQENKLYRISDITVLPDYRKQGLGHYLLKSIIHILHQRQKTIILDVETNNEIALNWYLNLGMKKINTADFWKLPFSELIK
jgi:GNAT superfamily N-acetyltransferase